MKTKNINYLPEIILNSELVLFNNSKLLKKDNSLYNNTHIKEIEKLRDEYTILDYSNDIGLQVKKKEIRDKIRNMSIDTYIDRDPNIFGDMVLLVINRLATSSKFSRYTYLSEMKSLAIQHILLYTHKFDPLRQSKITEQYVSAFAYLTTTIHNAFVATINTNNQEKQKV